MSEEESSFDKDNSKGNLNDGTHDNSKEPEEAEKVGTEKQKRKRFARFNSLKERDLHFGILSSPLPVADEASVKVADEASVKEDGAAEEESKEEHELAEEAADAEVEEIEENKSGFEETMRSTLRTLGVEVEDDDDWKQMVIKTRLTLKELKDSFVNSE